MNRDSGMKFLCFITFVLLNHPRVKEEPASFYHCYLSVNQRVLNKSFRWVS